MNKNFSIGYRFIYVLREMSFKKELTQSYVGVVEEFFYNQIKKTYNLDCLLCRRHFSDFWQSYDFYTRGVMSSRRINIFNILRECDIKYNVYYVVEFSPYVFTKMEYSWLGFSQSYRRFCIRNLRRSTDDLDCRNERIKVLKNKYLLVNLLKQLEIVDWELKEEVDKHLRVGFTLMLNLQHKVLEDRLEFNEIDEVESFFKRNEFKLNDVVVSKYYSRYVRRIYRFWQVYKSKENDFNLFDCLKQRETLGSEFIKEQFNIIIREMEELWVASDHIYTMYQIRTIRKQYML